MKKIINSVFALMLIAATAVTFTSCGDDDNDVPQVVAQSVDLVYDFCVSEDFHDLLDVTATYTDLKGQTVTSKIVDQPVGEVLNIKWYPVIANWQKAPVPFAKTVSIKFAIKEGVSIPEKVTCGVTIVGIADVTFNNGKTEAKECGGNYNTSVIKGTDLAAYVDRLNNRYNNIKLTVDKDGTVDGF